MKDLTLPTPALPPTIQGGAITDPEDKAFFAFWYGHMLNDLMQPPLSNVDHATARYIWNHARAALSSNHEDGGRAATDAEDARRWRQWRSGKPLIFTFAHPTPKKPNGTITISYGPNNEPGYAAALDDAVDKLIAAAATAAGEGTMSFGKRTTSADTASGHGIPDFTPTPEQADTAGPGQERRRDAQHKVAATAEGCGKVANGGDARLASGGCPNLSAGVALGGEKGEAVGVVDYESTGSVKWRDGLTQGNFPAGTPLFADPLGAEWQPIETAPKDGRYILLHRTGWQLHTVTACWLDPVGWLAAGAWWFKEATHWMPAPISPEVPT